MRIASRDSVWSEYGAVHAVRPVRESDSGSAPRAAETPVFAKPAASRTSPDQVPLDWEPAKSPVPREPDIFTIGKRAFDEADSTAAGEEDPATAARAKAQGMAAEEEAGRKKAVGDRRLSKEDKVEVEALRRRDSEVRAHEAAHMAAAGSMGGGASFDYQVGPDGRNYAVGGEVPVRTGTPSSPEEAIRNAAQLRAAALAPAEPSGQDRAVASQAAAMESAARAEMAARRNEASLRTAEIQASAAETAETGETEGSSASAGADQGQAAKAMDRDRMLRELESEQRLQRGGWQHLHMESSCGSCSSAVASYR